MTKFQVGQIWKSRNNCHWEIESTSDGPIYPIRVKRSESDLRVKLTSSGHMWESREGHIWDLIELVQDVPSKTLTNETRPEENKVNRINFWEARQAALAGKKVRPIDRTLIDWDCFTDDEIDNQIWSGTHFNADWEIVEEPVHVTYYVNVYRDSFSRRYKSTEEADKARCRVMDVDTRLSCLAITVDENGKLIEAKEVTC
jgi:hypothetical protein